jgi:hypothetical protein
MHVLYNTAVILKLPNGKTSTWCAGEIAQNISANLCGLQKRLAKDGVLCGSQVWTKYAFSFETSLKV